MSSEEQPDWLLERIRLGELPPHLAKRGESLSGDARSQRRLEELEQEQSDFAAKDHRQELDEIRRVAQAQARSEAAARRSSRRRAWGIAVPLVAMSLVLAVFPWQTVRTTPEAARPTVATGNAATTSASSQESVGPEVQPIQSARGGKTAAPEPSEQVVGTGSVTNGSTVRSKGDAVTFLIHRKRNGSAQRLGSGDTVTAGDMLQISVEAQHLTYLCIVSIDSIGTLTPHLPETPARAVVVDSGMRMVLPHAYELDASPGYERFLLVWSPAPFETARVLAALHALPPSQRRQGTPSLGDLQVRSLTFSKAPR